MAGQAANDAVHYRIGSIAAFFVVSTAVVMYGLGFLLALTGIGEIATEILDIGLSILFFFWFALLGVNYFQGRSAAKLGVMGACTLIETIPFLNALIPALVVETITIILITRKEDREKAAADQEKRAKEGAVAQQNQMRRTQYIAQRNQVMQEAANDNESVREAA
jgi:hypothetical protein